MGIHYQNLLIDPGPVCTQRSAHRYVRQHARRIQAVVATHWHEEHIGNVSELARRLGVPAFGTDMTLAEIRKPQRLSYPRRTLMGQPAAAATDLRLHPLGKELATTEGQLMVIDSPGHCQGHVSVYDPTHKILLAGDSFMHTVFTSPNADVRSDDWIQTLERYAALDVAIRVTGHGVVYARDVTVPAIPFVVRRADPNRLIRDKLAFLRWSRQMLEAGERRGLPYKVIEACLFPWSWSWAWRNWFNDEASRLFSAGEFSRTHFVRSLTSKPKLVPPRFPACWNMTRRFCLAAE